MVGARERESRKVLEYMQSQNGRVAFFRFIFFVDTTKKPQRNATQTYMYTDRTVSGNPLLASALVASNIPSRVAT
jgi:hypothetical protein